MDDTAMEYRHQRLGALGAKIRAALDDVHAVSAGLRRILAQIEEMIRGPETALPPNPGALDRRRLSWRGVGAVLLLLAAAAAVGPGRLQGAFEGAWRLTGSAELTDGDTLTVRGERVRLAGGVDAFESHQLCRWSNGGSYHCGLAALVHAEELIAGRPVTCRGSEGRDRYGRLLGRCFVGGEDLGRWLIAKGFAVVDPRYGAEYAGAEAAARSARRGAWQGEFDAPSEWRRERRGSGGSTSPSKRRRPRTKKAPAVALRGPAGA